MKWYKVCNQADLTIKTSMKVAAGELTIAVFHLTDGRFMAVEDRCPHKDGPLSDGIITGSTVTCPLHNWRINLINGEALPPDCGCVKTFKTKVKEDMVWVEL
ncbi:Nitrite reductase [NAD(P)H] small subunit [hydrothermal vent metagenome]|uniref:Nitrite reductase [NAD(P)H] small subunit n=1 Tax=hydrothermal vent metagenome TaxID=652676 RepID=A0A3B0R472_9ZZZZ